MSGKISLREPTPEDLKFIRWLWADPETMTPVGGQIIIGNQTAREWYARMISPGSSKDYYRIIINPDHTPVGEISFHRLDPKTMTADLNIKIAARFRGNGYAKGALRQFLEYFFNKFGGRLMQDRVAKTNPIGKNCLMEFGFVEVGSCGDADLLQLSVNHYYDLYRS